MLNDISTHSNISHYVIWKKDEDSQEIIMYKSPSNQNEFYAPVGILNSGKNEIVSRETAIYTNNEKDGRSFIVAYMGWAPYVILKPELLF